MAVLGATTPPIAIWNTMKFEVVFVLLSDIFGTVMTRGFSQCILLMNAFICFCLSMQSNRISQVSLIIPFCTETETYRQGGKTHQISCALEPDNGRQFVLTP